MQFGGRSRSRHEPSVASSSSFSEYLNRVVEYRRSRHSGAEVHEQPPDRGRPPVRSAENHAPDKGNKGKGVGSQSNFNAQQPNAAAMAITGLTSAVQDLRSEVHEMASFPYHNKVLRSSTILSKTEIEKLFGQLPRNIQKLLLKHRRQLEDYLKKLGIAVENKRRATEDKTLCKSAQTILEKQLQVAREELAAAAQNLQVFNPKVAWEQLMKKQSQEVQEFHNQMDDARIALYQSLTSLDRFGETCRYELIEELKEIPHHHPIMAREQHSILEACFIWLVSTHQRIIQSSGARFKAKRKQRTKYLENVAINKAQTEGMPTNELIARGLLEAMLTFAEPSDPARVQTKIRAQDAKAKKQVSSANILGALLSENPSLCKKYGVVVVDRPKGAGILKKRKDSRRSASKEQGRGRPRSRSSSKASSASFATVRSKSSTNSSCKSSKSRPSSRSSSQRSSSNLSSSRLSSSVRSSSSSKSPRASGGARRRKGSSKGKRVQVPQAKYQKSKRVFRKTTAASPRGR